MRRGGGARDQEAALDHAVEHARHPVARHERQAEEHAAVPDTPCLERPQDVDVDQVQAIRDHADRSQ